MSSTYAAFPAWCMVVVGSQAIVAPALATDDRSSQVRPVTFVKVNCDRDVGEIDWTRVVAGKHASRRLPQGCRLAPPGVAVNATYSKHGRKYTSRVMTDGQGRFTLQADSGRRITLVEELATNPGYTGRDGDGVFTEEAGNSGYANLIVLENVRVQTFSLTVLQSNDGESKVVNSGVADFGGIARFATVVGNLRLEASAEASSSILINAGDNIIPGPNFNANVGNPAPSGRYYDSIALDRIRFDALAIGNHEFDSGPDVFATFIQGFKGGNDRFVSANLDYHGEPRLQALKAAGVLVESFVLRRTVKLQQSRTLQQQRIGVIGLTTPELPNISSPRGVTVDPDLVSVVQREIDELTAKGVNIVVLTGQLQTINNDRALVQQLKGLDIVISGGGQETLANPGALLIPGEAATLPYPVVETDASGRDVPIVTTNGDYKYVGRLITQFDNAGNLVSIDPRSNPVRVVGGNYPDAVQPEPSLQQEVVEPVQTYLDSLAVNIVATTEVGLDGRRGAGNGNPTLVQPGVRTQETNLGSLFADALLWEARRRSAEFGIAAGDIPTVGIQNGGGIRNNNIIGPGNVTELNTYQIANFFNIVAVVPNVPAAQFKEILENAVSRVDAADGRFAQVAGFQFIYDEDAIAQVLDASSGNVITPGSRVREVRLLDGPAGTPGTYVVQDGNVVNPALTIDIATIDFLARGGDSYPYRGAPFTIVGSTYQEALFRYLTFTTSDGGLGGAVGAARYPQSGLGRITRIN
jgi:5'-nucleotidase